MTKTEWMLFAIRAVDKDRYQYGAGASTALEIVAETLAERDAALETLRKKGYALIGMSLTDAVESLSEKS